MPDDRHTAAAAMNEDYCATCGQATYKTVLRGKTVGLDRCIGPLVHALNAAGLKTVWCCCGHGWLPATIVLQGGKELRLMDFDTARWLDRQWPWTIHGEPVGWQDPVV